MSHLNRSTLFAQDRKWEEAASELESVLQLQPDNIQVYGDLASMYLRAGKTDETAAEAAGRLRERGVTHLLLDVRPRTAYPSSLVGLLSDRSRAKILFRSSDERFLVMELTEL